MSVLPRATKGTEGQGQSRQRQEHIIIIAAALASTSTSTREHFVRAHNGNLTRA